MKKLKERMEEGKRNIGGRKSVKLLEERKKERKKEKRKKERL